MGNEFSSLALASESEEETRRLGRHLGELLRPGDVVLLEGEFGVGKTVFAQGVAAGLGVHEYVTSPSFTLINEYRAPRFGSGFCLYHVDLYRVENAGEMLDLGLLDYVGGEGVCLVEWAERLRPLLPSDYLLVRLTTSGPTSRRIFLEAHGERHRALLSALAEAVAGD